MEQEQQPVSDRELFFHALYAKFRELRPLFKGQANDPTDPIFQKLFVIDRVLTNLDMFEIGLAVWLENRDIDAFLNEAVRRAFSPETSKTDDPTTNT